MPIFRVKSVKIYTGQKKFTRTCPWRPWQIWGMRVLCFHSPYHKTRMICLTRDKSAYHQSNVPPQPQLVVCHPTWRPWRQEKRTGGIPLSYPSSKGGGWGGVTPIADGLRVSGFRNLPHVNIYLMFAKRGWRRISNCSRCTTQDGRYKIMRIA